MEGSGCSTCHGIVLELVRLEEDDSDEEEKPSQAAGSDIDVMEEGKPDYLAAPINLLWENAQVFQVWFLNGNRYPAHAAFVVEAVQEWEKHANVSFTFPSVWDPNSPPEVRLRFWRKPPGFKPENKHDNIDDGNWSYVGVDSKLYTGRDDQADIRNNFWNPTISLNPDDLSRPHSRDAFRGTILHEFGHTLGFMHEHQRPDGELLINYDRTRIYKHYWKKLRWKKQKVNEQVLNFHQYRGKTDIAGSKFDTASIMMYDLPEEVLKPGSTIVPRNIVLSETDKKFVGELYPKESDRLILAEQIIPDP